MMLIPASIIVSRPPKAIMVRTRLHTTNLLEHLIHVGKDRSVQVPILVHNEAILESALCHFEDGVLDSIELALNRWIVFGEVRQSAKYLQRFLLASFEDKPTKGMLALLADPYGFLFQPPLKRKRCHY